MRPTPYARTMIDQAIASIASKLDVLDNQLKINQVDKTCEVELREQQRSPILNYKISKIVRRLFISFFVILGIIGIFAAGEIAIGFELKNEYIPFSIIVVFVSSILMHMSGTKLSEERIKILMFLHNLSKRS